MDQCDREVKETAIYPGYNGLKFKIDPVQKKQILAGNATGLIVATLGLGEKCAKFSNKAVDILKSKDSPISLKQRASLAHDLGGVYWYLSRCAAELRYNLQMISDINYEKLSKRKREGTLKGSGDER